MKNEHQLNTTDIAIIGIACRFPDADNKSHFWQNLLSGKESVRPLTYSELEKWGIGSYLNDPEYVNASAVINNPTYFDYRFFGYSKKEAELMDPQQRLFLQTAWHALEDAGYIPNEQNEKIGVFASARTSSWVKALAPEQLSTSEGFQTLMGNDKDYLATKIAYKLGFTGPAMTIQTACSSSLVAIYQACSSIISGDCSMALAGGVALTFPAGCGYLHNEGMIFSPDGHCRPFSSEANGIVGGNGVGIIVLKPAKQAIEDNDKIYAVIKGGAVNNDGNQKVGYTAPSVQGQKDVIERALARSAITPDKIGYLEAHGTGTVLGDPIEIKAISLAWDCPSTMNQYCAVGSVKGNIGHLDTAAGVASIIKTALALYYGQIPPSINCLSLNPAINFDHSPFFVAKDPIDWPLTGTRYAAVSCFGIGGTNCHMILSQSPEIKPNNINKDTNNNYALLSISAPDKEALIRQLDNWQNTLSLNIQSNSVDNNIEQWGYAAIHYRKQFPNKITLAINSLSDAVTQISHLDNTHLLVANQSAQGVVMMFSGQGGQWTGMGKELFSSSVVYRDALNECKNWMWSNLQLDITDLMFNEDIRLNDTRYAQPAIFAHQYALYRCYLSFGIKPIAVLGHSLGEFMAAVASGIMSAQQAAVLITERAALMASINHTGSMIAINTDTNTLTQLSPHWQEHIDLATINSPTELVLSGPSEPISQLRERLLDANIIVHQLAISVPCHSRYLVSIAQSFAEKVNNITFNTATIPFYSTVSTQQVSNEDICCNKYWAEQLLKPVLFYQTIETIYKDYGDIPLLEIGPSKVLSRYTEKRMPSYSAQLRKGNAERDFWNSLAWLSNYNITVHISKPAYINKDIPLPLYSFANDECHQYPMVIHKDQIPSKPYGIDLTNLLKQATVVSNEKDLSMYQQLTPIANRFVAHYAWEALQKCGWIIETDNIELYWQQQSVPKYRYPLLRRFIKLLLNTGYLVEDRGVLKIVQSHPVEDIEQLKLTFRHVFNLALEGNFDDLVDLLNTCGQHLAGMLSDNENPVDIVFRDNGAAILNRFYSETVNAKVVNQWLANTAQALYLQHQKSARSLFRILEIGAGTGASTQSVLTTLKNCHIDYVFSDVSKSFLDSAREKFADYPHVSFNLYDLNRDDNPYSHQFDLIIAANSLHACKNINNAINGIKSCLKSGGYLLLRELTVHYALFDLLFGPLAAIPDDAELRGDNLILSETQWQDLLIKNGFAQVDYTPRANEPLSVFGESIIVAALPEIEIKSMHSCSETEVSNLGLRLPVSTPTYQVNWQSDDDWWSFSILALRALRDVFGNGIYQFNNIQQHNKSFMLPVLTASQYQLIIDPRAGGQGKIQLAKLTQNNVWQSEFTLSYKRCSVLNQSNTQPTQSKIEYTDWRLNLWPEQLNIDTDFCDTCDSVLTVTNNIITDQNHNVWGVLKELIEEATSVKEENLNLSQRPLESYIWQWQPISDMDMQLRIKQQEPLYQKDKLTLLIGKLNSPLIQQAKFIIEAEGGYVDILSFEQIKSESIFTNHLLQIKPTGIIFVSDQANEEIDSLYVQGESLLAIIQAINNITSHSLNIPCLLLTQNAYHQQYGIINPIVASLTQMLRLARNEITTLKVMALNIDDQVLLSTELLHYIDSPFLIHYAKNQLYYPTLVTQKLITPLLDSVIHPDGLYLVFGLGGIGCWLVEWLAKQGAKSIAVWLRKEPNIKQTKIIDSLKNLGVNIYLNSNVDAKKHQSIQQAWSQLPTTPAGIFVLVGEASSQLITTLKWNECWNSMVGKINAAHSLVKLGKQAEFIQLFSSSATLTSLPGLFTYTSANSYLEGLANQQWFKGYPVMSVGWGNWYQTGMDSGFSEESLNKLGFFSQTVDEVDSLQNTLLASGQGGHYSLCKIDWDIFIQQHNLLPANQMLFDRLLSTIRTKRGSGYNKRNKFDDQRGILRKLTAEQQKKHIRKILLDLLSDRLQIAESQLTDETDLFTIGMDSLVFVDLSQALRRLFKIHLPVSESYQFKVFGDLQNHIWKRYLETEIDFENLLHTDDVVIPDLLHRTDPFPLTDLQQAFWIGRNDSLSLGSVSCHQYSELELEHFDLAYFESIWNKLVQRHDMLRAIVLEDGTQQVLSKVPHYNIEQYDLTRLDEPEKQAKLDSIREEMTYQVFDPTKWPLFDIRASKINETKTRLHIDLDVLMVDVHSFRILYGELNRLMSNHQEQLNPLPLTFRDCIQQEYKERNLPDYQEAKSYWQERAKTLPPAPQLPLRINPEQLKKPRFRTLTQVINRQLWQKLKHKATSLGVTSTAIILTAFSEVIKRWSREPHFTLNMTYYNRKSVHEQIMDVVGDFTSIMLLEANLSEKKSFSQRVNEIQQELWCNLDHRQYSGVEVMREMARQNRASGRQVHMPVVFTSLIGMDFDNNHNADWDMMGKQIYQVNQTPQVWLDYQLVEYGGNLLNRWFIVDQLFEPQVIEAMFTSFNTLLEFIADDNTNWNEPITELIQLSGLVDHSKQNYFIVSRPKQLMHECFLLQADKTPLNPALLTSNQQWTYRELRDWVNQLANRLISLDIKQGDRVAIVMNKCAENIVAALAVQCVGAAYVPIAVDGEARCQAILKDCQPALILTTPQWFEDIILRCQPLNLHHLIYSIDESVFNESIDFSPISISPNEPAYLIYTSGSTGKPKGVLLDHQAPLNTVLSMNEYFNIQENDRFLSLTPPNHDMAVYDIYGPLAVGAAIVIPDEQQRKEVTAWITLMQQYKVTTLNVVPTFVDMLVSYLEITTNTQNEIPQELRLIMMGGDWIPIDLPKRIRQFWPNIALHSIGGPTETAIVSVTYPIGEVSSDWKSIPYGKPLANQKMYILNQQLESCPEAVVGEICAGGQCLALGYYNDPKRTEEKFIIYPATGERLYLTGDLGCFLPDGNIQILGRLDQQLSVNGYRIEPGEIEANIRTFSGIKEAVVVKAGQPESLHAFIIPAFEDEVNEQGIISVQQAENPVNLQQIHEKALTAVTQLPEDLSIIEYDKFFSKLEFYSLMVIWRFIRQYEQKGQVDTKSIISQIVIKTNYLHLLQSWLDELVKEGIYELETTLTSNHYFATKKWDEEQWRSIQAWFDHYISQCSSNDRSIWLFFHYCTQHLPELLSGQVNPLEHMFKDGDTNLAENFYQNNRIPRHFNQVSGQAVADFVKQWPKDRPLKVLEFGAGVGSITASVLPQLPLDRTSYLFTDLSTFFFDKAREKFANYSFIQYGLFDINKDPLEQGLSFGQFDLILGANVLHDAHNIDITLPYLRELLSPGGLLMILEGTYNPRFQLISFGFIEGLTQYQDERINTHLPLLPASRWIELMNQANFATCCVPESGMDEEVFNYHLLIAQAPLQTTVINFDPLRRMLHDSLPDYMVPRSFYALRKLPLSANGKIDRKELAQKIITTSKKVITPQKAPTEMEQCLISIWQQVLKTDNVSIDSNFFAVGGDSLLMTRISGLIKKQWHIELSLGRLLSTPNLSEQVDLIETSVRLIANNESLSTDYSEPDKEAFDEGEI